MPAPPGRRPTPLLRLYAAASRSLVPFAYRSVARKLRGGGVSDARIRERLGQSDLSRPEGRLVWIHAASVGESLAGLSVLEALAARLTGAEFLVTSGTATSAEILARRLPPSARHQFAPLDAPGPVARFLDHWRPQAGIFVESELWPNLLRGAQARGVPLALVNARLSRRSVEGWQRWPGTARQVLDAFAVMIAQNRQSADDLVAMGADPARVRTGVNLKSLARPLPVDMDLLEEMRAALDSRPVWVASSTHPGEEEIILAAHARLLERHPDLCLLLVPRHPARGSEVAALIAEAGLGFTRRSAGERPGAGAQVYLADTLGETGTWYALSPIVFLGGSLKPIGGHNPFEPAQAGAAVMTGPEVFNFSETFDPLIAVGAARWTADADAIAAQAGRWLDDAGELAAARAAARAFTARQGDALETLADSLVDALGLDADG